MSTIDLMLLGVLVKEPMSAYDMKKVMERRRIQDWIKISSPSVYKNLLKLCSRGYLDSTTVRDGDMPEKRVYTINDRGRRYFLRLMERYSRNPGTLYVDFAAFIANLANLDRDAAVRMVDDLEESLALKLAGVKDQLARMDGVSFYGAAIVDLYSRMYEVCTTWAAEFKRRYLGEERAGR